jgi:hypothetical protein
VIHYWRVRDLCAPSFGIGNLVYPYAGFTMAE